MKLLQERNYKCISALTIIFGGVLAASVAVASNGHGGGHDDDDGYGGDHGNHKQQEPRFVDRGDSLRASATVRGLNRKHNVRAELEAEAEVEVECIRKGASHKRYMKEIDIEVDGAEWFSRHKIHNNRLEIRVETDDIGHDFDHYYGHACKKNYKAYVRDVRFSSAKLEVRQGHREIVTWLCSFDHDTKNGPIPRRDVDCVTLH